MLKFLLFAALLTVAVNAATEQIPILSQESEVDHSGKFYYKYETGDGSKVAQEGELKTIDKEQGEVVKGDFEYTGDDGKHYKVTYTADENGYQPQGEHIPQVPPLIARALKYLATAPPPKDEKH